MQATDTRASRFSGLLMRTAMIAAFLLSWPGASSAGAAPATDASRAAWVLAYQGKSTNSFIWDRRTKRLVDSRVPAALSSEVLSGLGGPPDPVLVTEGRYLAASGCVAHSCTDKGFFWIDARTGAGLGAYYSGDELLIGSNSMRAGRIPAPAQHALRAWLQELELSPASVTFVAHTGETTPLAAAQFTLPAQFRSSPTGPSFDCRKASTLVEKAVCSNASLSMQDLELGRLLKSVRHGHATVGAREELRALQRHWLKERDTRCAASADLDACLASQYRAQHDRLRNWVPAGRLR
ncbi:MAG: DUF1311 domain-containing protein [Lysobacteraceae bacterium]|nr:MAG: DUF1311 domain-containing protein [Xanthomonadaceae bacterium]